MKRADRLQPVQKIVDDTERRLAEHLASSERLVRGCEQKLNELLGYRNDYTQGFARRAAGGMGARELLDYQAFMVKLGEAVSQQEKITEQARQERDLQKKRWQDEARRAKALGHVIHHWQQDELKVQERRDQKDTDERAQRKRVVHE
jgi:flagellar protein FliJ